MEDLCLWLAHRLLSLDRLGLVIDWLSLGDWLLLVTKLKLVSQSKRQIYTYR